MSLVFNPGAHSFERQRPKLDKPHNDDFDDDDNHGTIRLKILNLPSMRITICAYIFASSAKCKIR